MEKYYLKNILIDDPYREFLTSYAEATLPQHFCTEYKQRYNLKCVCYILCVTSSYLISFFEYALSYSGNPVMSTASSGRIYGISRPTDISKPVHWKRYLTQKLRDVNFTHDKETTDSHMDYNDPKRYNPWPRLKMSYDQMLENNYRPRPASGVNYSTTTLLPAVSPYSKLWII